MANAAVLSSADIATQAATLRAELKEWEKAFAAANGGRKAGREDIKKDPTIAAKYKAYARLRSHDDQSSTVKGKDSPTKPTKPLKPGHQESKERKHGSPTGPGNQHSIASTPRKAAKGDFLTPSKGRISDIHPSELDPYDSPSTLRRLFSPSTHKQEPSPLPLKTAIGPTPQRDGKTLGLFDLLSASGGSTATPSAKRLSTLSGAAMETPSRKRTLDTIEEEDEEEIGRIERTPASSSKKLYLENLFATPTTLRYAAMVEDEKDRLHGSQQANGAGPNASKTAEPEGSETPSFLRRSHSGVFNASNSAADGSGLSPIAVRKPQQRFVGKGLSALVRGLRDMERDREEERMRDDWETFREIEAEQAAAAAAASGNNDDDVQMADSQAPADGEQSTSRPWKKKGQKRQTRRVLMRPVVAKPKPESQRKSPEKEDDDDESEDELATAPTKCTDAGKADQEDNEEEQDEAEEVDDADSVHTADLDSDSDYDEDSAGKKSSSSFSEKIRAALSEKSKGDKSEKSAAEGETKAKKPAARKINPQAHANYRSLKIRSKGSKGKGYGRWGRRR